MDPSAERDTKMDKIISGIKDKQIKGLSVDILTEEEVVKRLTPGAAEAIRKAEILSSSDVKKIAKVLRERSDRSLIGPVTKENQALIKYFSTNSDANNYWQP